MKPLNGKEPKNIQTEKCLIQGPLEKAFLL